MRNDDQPAREAWAKSLAHARMEQGLSELELARELLLSPAQLRDIENASLQSFHGISFYHRAVQKLADRLGVTLDPPIESTLAASKPDAAKDAHLTQQSDTLSKRPPLRTQGVVLPTQEASRGPVKLLLGLTVVIAVGAGIYLSLAEGWPFKQSEKAVQAQNSTLIEAPIAVEEQERIAMNSAPVNVAPAQVVVEVIEPQTAPSNTDDGALETSASNNADASLSDGTPAVAASSASVSEPVSEPVPAREPETVPEPEPISEPQPDLIEARFSDDCWVEVRYKDGRIEQKIYTDQEVLTVDVATIEGLVFGNAQAVQANRQSEPWDIMVFAGGRNVARIDEADLNQAGLD